MFLFIVNYVYKYVKYFKILRDLTKHFNWVTQYYYVEKAEMIITRQFVCPLPM